MGWLTRRKETKLAEIEALTKVMQGVTTIDRTNEPKVEYSYLEYDALFKLSGRSDLEQELNFSYIDTNEWLALSKWERENVPIGYGYAHYLTGIGIGTARSDAKKHVNKLVNEGMWDGDEFISPNRITGCKLTLKETAGSV
jgi:hypothetical protein